MLTRMTLGGDTTDIGDPLNDLVLEWEDARQRSEPITPEQLCARVGRPEWLGELRQRVAVLSAMASVVGAGRLPDATSSSAGSDRRVGSMVGRWRLTRRLGEGGSGVVYQADEIEAPPGRSPRRAAVKLLTGLLGGPLARKRFLREADLARRLRHPNVVRVFEADRHEGLLFLAMELVPGGSLSELLARRGRLPWPEAVALVVDAARGLAAAHAAGLVHRDIKPGNLLLDAVGHVKIADFGIAKAMREGSPRLSTASGLVGTPAYMSPEQVRGEKLDGRSDLYSLGATLQALLTGEPPMPNLSGPWAALVAGRARRNSPSQELTAPATIPEPCRAVLARALAADPADRYARAEEMQAALERLLAGVPGPAGQPDGWLGWLLGSGR